MANDIIDMDLPEEGHGFDFDVIVIGAGSGGLACAKRIKQYGVNVAVCDFVVPSPPGTKWGIGGTCVNVGCIPKKLMHTAALHGEALRHNVGSFGWSGPTGDALPPCDWVTLRNNVTMHVRSLNFGYNVELRELGIKYFNAFASFTGPKTKNTLKLVDKDGKEQLVSARRIILAMGGRPTYPDDCPGAREFGITSDDIFRLEKDPGKTCVVGASYVALECAGFLRGIGRDVTVLIRSIPLRGYDQDMANKAVAFMETVQGVKFMRRTVPSKVEKLPTGRLLVHFRGDDGSTAAEEYDTILFAIGRTPETMKLNLPLDLAIDGKSKKVKVNRYDRTTVRHVYSIGDIVEGGLELTPVAIRQGRLLADRLYGGSDVTMDFINVATTVFTPLEYGCVGLSEEAAIARFGEDNINVYHSEFTPLEWTVPHLPINQCYMKLICHGEEEVIVGFHILAPNAGEITQGVAVAMRAKATKEHFDSTVGIHPTVAEEMTVLTVTKRSGQNAGKKGC